MLALIKIEYYYDWAAAEAPSKERSSLIQVLQCPIGYTAPSYLSAIGKHDELIAELTRALELDPLSIMINADFGYSYHNKREYDKAVEQWQKTLELDPNIFMALMGLGLTYRAMGEYEKSIESLQKCAELTQRWPGAIALLAAAHAAAGQRARALELLEELQQRAKREQVGSIFFAWAYIGLGDYDRAFNMLMRAYEEPAPWLAYAKVWSFYDPLRSDPRFTELLRKVGLKSVLELRGNPPLRRSPMMPGDQRDERRTWRWSVGRPVPIIRLPLRIGPGRWRGGSPPFWLRMSSATAG